MSEEEDVWSRSSSSESENLVETRNICSICKKSVKNKVQCKKCKLIFHPGCMVNANKVQNRTCTHEVADRQDIIEKLMLEIKYLKKVKKQQEGRIETLKENNKLLEENSKLLKENYELLHEKVERLTAKGAKTYSAMVRSEVSHQQKNEIPRQAIRKTKQITTANSQQKQPSENSQPVADIFDIRQGPSTSSSSNRSDETIEGAQKNETTSQREKDGEWRVKSKHRNVSNRNRKPLFYGTSRDTNNIKGIPRKIWFFVSRLDPQMTEQTLKDAIKNKCTNVPDADIVVEKQDVFHKFQSAFKVGLPINLEEQAKSPVFWPLDSKVNMFNFFLQRKKENPNR